MELLILAAGMGSRFGGLKQMQPIDDKGNFIIDYSIYDAAKAGFDRIVFLIKEEMKEEFENTVGKRASKYVEVAYAYQNKDNLPDGFVLPKERVKPLGTVHALYCAKDVLKGHFAIINADDYYGPDAFKKAAEYLRSLKEDEVGKCANIAYLAKNTLSDKGAVKRGVLDIDADDYLTDLMECNIEQRDNDIYAAPLNSEMMEKIDINTMVSMNFFIFTKDCLNEVGTWLQKFLIEHKNNLMTAEYIVTDMVSSMLENKKVTCKVISTHSVWHGITYREDLLDLTSSLEKLVSEGLYPKDLF